jgi:hypothetical protein
VPVRTTFVNTLAIRRQVFAKYPFPEESALYMGQGVLWNRTLFENGVPIFLNSEGARCAPASGLPA